MKHDQPFTVIITWIVQNNQQHSATLRVEQDGYSGKKSFDLHQDTVNQEPLPFGLQLSIPTTLNLQRFECKTDTSDYDYYVVGTRKYNTEEGSVATFKIYRNNEVYALEGDKLVKQQGEDTSKMDAFFECPP